MKIVILFGLLLPLSMSAATVAAEDDVKELIPTGKLRAGLAYAPAKTPVFVTKDASGQVEGVGLDLAKALARSLGVEVELFVAPTTGELTDASGGRKDRHRLHSRGRGAQAARRFQPALFHHREHLPRHRRLGHHDAI